MTFEAAAVFGGVAVRWLCLLCTECVVACLPAPSPLQVLARIDAGQHKGASANVAVTWAGCAARCCCRYCRCCRCCCRRCIKCECVSAATDSSTFWQLMDAISLHLRLCELPQALGEHFPPAVPEGAARPHHPAG